MTYRATMTSAIGLYSIGLGLALLFVAMGVLSRPVDAGLLIAGGVVLAWMAAIRIRYTVRVSEEALQARTLVGESRVKWQEIVRVRPAAECGYWASRFVGPSTLDFVSTGTHVRVNFKLFSAECLQDVMQRVPPGARAQG